LSNLGKYQEAISWFDMALKIDPNFVDSLYIKLTH
jgi:Tetratricopeptide repeat.